MNQIFSHAITRRSLALWVSIIQQLFDAIQLLQDIRKHLVSPLPKDCRLTVRSPYPWPSRATELCPLGHPRCLLFSHAPQLGALYLSLLHSETLSMYALLCAPSSVSHRRNFQAALDRKKNPPALQSQARRRHTVSEIQPRLWNHASHAHVVFMRAVMAARVISRLRILVENNSNGGKVVDPRPRCGSAFCAYALLSSPLVVRNLSVVSLLAYRSLFLCRYPFRRALITRARSRTRGERVKE